ncbi:extracellular solute-binding protein [Anaerobacillus sp. CMMVII]|uniref:extracellular solute-binding protein n=1 Tax=Anaerobacillus sp. CMMVII TaxID=2755588 RepID=UPI0021B816AC|nr:extracellular solute-binding protein [Anaerobacillus sp. CMMVII]MCT8137878.1 extracellular solute-binding protein [Anaerobacillus sp. CMMVII]
MFKKSTLLTLVLMLMLALALAACGGKDETKEPTPETPATDETPAEEPATGEPAKPESLTMWVNDEESQLDAYEEIASRYEAERGIKVNITPFSMLDQVDALSLDGPAGKGPDIFFHPHDRVGSIFLQGLAAELEVTEEQLAGYPEGALQALSYEGIQFGIPAVIETYGLFYNTDLIPEAPETMDDLLAIAKELTNAANNEYGFLMEATNFYFTYPFLAGPGGYVFGRDAEGGYNIEDIGLGNAGAVKGGELIQSWFTDGLIPQGITGDVMNGLFREGKVGAVVTGPWSIPDYVADLGDKLKVTTLPTIDGKNLNSFSGVKGWFVSEYSENKYWATDLALFITNATNGEHYFNVAGEIPARTDVTIDDELRNGILAQAEFAEPMPNVPEMSQVWEPMADALNFISNGDDVAEVLEEAVEQISEQIALTAGN